MVVAHIQTLHRHHLESKIPAGLGKGQGSLASVNSLIIIAYEAKMSCDMSRHLAQSRAIIEGLCEPFSLVQDVEAPLEFSRHREWSVQGEAEVDGLLLRIAA